MRVSLRPTSSRLIFYIGPSLSILRVMAASRQGYNDSTAGGGRGGGAMAPSPLCLWPDIHTLYVCALPSHPLGLSLLV